MSNVIQIKRGSGTPDNKLAPYELGIDTDDGQLYYGGLISNSEYGKAQGIKVAKAKEAEEAIKIVNENGEKLTLGNTTTPIYLDEGKFKTCGGSSISGTIEKAKMLETPREIKVDLAAPSFAKFNGQQDITTGVTGTLPISKGGTDATTAAAARANLGAAAANHTHSYLPLTGGTLTGALALTHTTADNVTYTVTLSGAGIDCDNTNINGINRLTFNDAAESVGEGILFPRNDQSGIQAWDGIWAQNGVLKFTTNYGNSPTNHVVVHTGNHFTQIAAGKDISDGKSFTINNVSGYTAFVFLGYTAGSEDHEGWSSVVTPAHFITSNTSSTNLRSRSFTLGHATDSKRFKVTIDTSNKMTVVGEASSGSGIKTGHFYVYGIK